MQDTMLIALRVLNKLWNKPQDKHKFVHECALMWK
jgi:hypothetical protein